MTVTGPPPRAGGRRDEYRQLDVEPMTGIEPAYSAWEAISSVERAFRYWLDLRVYVFQIWLVEGCQDLVDPFVNFQCQLARAVPSDCFGELP